MTHETSGAPGFAGGTVWQALRAELFYALPYLLAAFGTAAGAALVVSALSLVVGGNAPPRQVVAGLRAMFAFMAPMVVGFIVQATRVEERRTRLLLAGSSTPLGLGVVTVLLPAVLFGLGTLAAATVLGVELLVTGRLARVSVILPGFVGTMMFLVGLLVLLGSESATALTERRRQEAAAGWTAFAIAVALLTVLSTASFWRSPEWASLVAGALLVAIIAMAASVALFASRRDFTR
jgi:hypothetical protein